MTTTNHEARLVEAIKAGVSSGTLTAAVTFLRQLPARAQASAEFALWSDGKVRFEWRAGVWILTVAVDEWFRVSYSGTFGEDRLSGSQTLNGPLHHVLVAAIDMMVDRKWELGEFVAIRERDSVADPA